MAVTRVGSTSGVDTATLPAHQAGDLIVVYTFRDGSATIPTLPAGYTSLGTTTTTTITASRIAYKYATSSSETLGTWTNATALIAHVYRGAILSPAVGNANASANSNSAYIFGPLTTYGPGTSWVAAFMGHVNTDTTLTNVAIGPLTTVVNYSDATNKAWSGDTNGAIDGWPGVTPPTVGGTVGGWCTAHLEICDVASVLSTPRLVTTAGASAATVTTSSFTPLANETLFVACDVWDAPGVPAQPTISDSIGLTWTEIDDLSYNTGANPYLRQRIWWANVGASPASMTVTTAATAADGTSCIVVGMNGVDTTYGFANKGTNTSAAGDPSTTLASQPHPFSTTLIFTYYGGGNGITPATGYTELLDSAVATSRISHVQYDPTAPTIGAHATTSINSTGMGCEFEVRPANLPTFAFRAVNNPTAVASGNLTFTEPTGAAQGDLFVVGIDYRDTVGFGLPAGWTLIQNNNTGANQTANGIPAGMMAYIKRGASAPDLTFTRTGGDLGLGSLCAYTPKNLTDTITFDTSSVNRQTSTATSTGTAITAAAANELIVGYSGHGRDAGGASWSRAGATSPNWFNERADLWSATGGDGSMTMVDAIKPASGSTGSASFVNVFTPGGTVTILAAFGLVASGPTAYTMPADAGSHALAGQDVLLAHGVLTTADAGSYALTGQDVTLTKTAALNNYSMPAAAGAYALSGVAVTTLYGRIAVADSSSYPLTGQDVATLYGRRTTADAGSYVLAGQDVTLTKAGSVLNNYTMPATSGAYALAGQAVTLALVRKVIADVGAYTLTGQAAALALVRKVIADVGAYTLTGQDATLSKTTAPLTWDPTRKAASITLSNGNLTASHATGIYADRAVYATASGAKTSGKWYFEVTRTLAYTPENTRIGIADPAQYAVGSSQAAGNSFCGVAFDGFVMNDGTATAFDCWTGMADGDVISVCYDLDNLRMWFRRNGSIWNNNAANNPATNTGGRTMSGATTWTPCLQMFNDDEVVTGRFKASDLLYAIPAGFSALVSTPTNYTMPAAAGSYTLTGQAATLAWASPGKVKADAGSYTLTGQVVGLIYVSGGAQFFSPQSNWNTKIPGSPPLASNSASIISQLQAIKGPTDTWQLNNHDWAVNVAIADGTEPLVQAVNPDTWRMIRIPQRSDAIGAPDPSDKHLVIVAKARGLHWGFQGDTANTGATSGTPITAGAMGIFRNDGPGWWDPDGGPYPNPWTGRSSNASLLGGLIFSEELDAGVIPHALAFAVDPGYLGSVPVLPALTTDGSVIGGIPNGSRLQINPSVNLNSLGLGAHAKIICKALQDYGGFVVERGDGFALYFRSDGNGRVDWSPYNFSGLTGDLFQYMRVIAPAASYEYDYSGRFSPNQPYQAGQTKHYFQEPEPPRQITPHSYAVAGQDVVLTKAGAPLNNYSMPAAAGAYALAGQAVTTLVTRTMTADAGSYALTGQAVAIGGARTMLADAGSYALAGQVVGLTYQPLGHFSIAANPSSYALGGQDVTLTAPRKMLADAGAYALAGQDVLLTKGSRALAIAAAAGSYALNGQVAALRRGYVLDVENGIYFWAVQDVETRAGLKVPIKDPLGKYEHTEIKKPAIPVPREDEKALVHTTTALKEAVEIMQGQRGKNQMAASVRWQDLVDMGLIKKDQVPSKP